jgi:hypothetical protein
MTRMDIIVGLLAFPAALSVALCVILTIWFGW